MGQSFTRRLVLCLTLIVAVLAIPIRVLAQDPTPAPSAWWIPILATLVPIISGFLAKYLADGLKQIVGVYDTAPTVVKQVVSVLIGFFVGWVNTKLTLATPLGADVHGWTADVIGGILTALAQAGIYRLDKNKQLAMQGNARLEQQAAKVNPRA
jgi:hypothetical protein